MSRFGSPSQPDPNRSERHTFLYEASDIPTGLTLAEYGARHRGKRGTRGRRPLNAVRQSRSRYA